MSSYRHLPEQCAVCGQTSTQVVLVSTNAFGPPDLDMRPPGMHRRTMHAWAHSCPYCGYAARDIADPCPVDPKILQTKEYLTCDGMPLTSDLAKRFYRQHLILREAGDVKGAYTAMLHAAWTCDDMETEDLAAECRRLAIAFCELLLTKVTKEQEKNTLMVVKADLLRRSGQFDRLLDEYADVQLGEKLLDDIVAFEMEKAKQKDADCYCVANVTT